MTTLGTAGHIDHGKTALVRALTGVDTDRLPEERERGISIALGYAPLVLPSGRRLSVIDVPGHERFVRTMVAGATGIDLYLMTIAADDGVMPQTREHAAVLAALGVATGVVAITKADLADPERARAEAAELLPDAPAVAVSARTGAGLGALREALERAADAVPPREREGPLRLHVDRAFTIRGAGTVVTGTLWSGSAARGDEVEILPAGRSARVRFGRGPRRAARARRCRPARGPQPRRRPARRGDPRGRDRGAPSRRVAVRARLAAEGGRPRGRRDVPRRRRASWAAPDARPEGGARVAVHHGPRESTARLAELGGRFFQLRLEQPIVPLRGDRVVIRSLAPPDTLGGGVVLDPTPRRHGPSRDLLARLAALERGDEPPRAPAPEPKVARAGPAPLTNADRAVEARLRDAGSEPPLDAELDARALASLRAHGRAVRLTRTMHVHPDALADVTRRLVAALERDGSITLAGVRDELGTSRKYAQAYLEHLDAERVTLRRGDERVLRRRR